MEWNWLAILVLSFLILSIIHGTIRGLHRCLVDFIFMWGVILTFIYGFRFAYSMAGGISEDEVIRTLVAAIGLLIISVAVFGMLSEFVLKSDLQQLLGNRINSGFGMVYGLIRGIFIIVLVWLIFTSLASETLVNKTRSHLPSDLLDSLSSALWKALPSTIGSRAEEIKEQVVKQTGKTPALLK